MKRAEERPMVSEKGTKPILGMEEVDPESCPTCISGVDAVVQESKLFEQALGEES